MLLSMMRKHANSWLIKVLIGIIAFSLNSILHTSPKLFRIDVTDEQVYSLSEGTKATLAKLNQQVTIKLYFSRTVALNAPDQIQFYTTYYNFVKTLLEEYVKPAVEQDGGAIEFHSFNDGVVKVLLKGACSGCPSSTYTLKAGIENLLRSMIPEVKSVEAEGV